MKTRNVILLGTLGLFFLLFSGCYTQLGTIRDNDDRWSEHKEYRSEERSDEEQYSPSDTESYEDEKGTTIINNYYGDGWYPRWRGGFRYYYPSYYWPSYAFTVAYIDPWFYDYYWYYDPWWCGTPYVVYRGYWYPLSYYYPRWGYGYTYATTPPLRGGRTFGTTRSSTGRDRGTAVRTVDDNSSRTEIGTIQLPTGSRLDGTNRTESRGNSTTNVGTQRRGSERVSRFREERKPNGRIDRGTRSTRSRETGEQEYRNIRGEETPSLRDNGSSRNTVPTYTPPVVRTPSSPPPSVGTGSQAPANTGTRGGTTRSGRR